MKPCFLFIFLLHMFSCTPPEKKASPEKPGSVSSRRTIDTLTRSMKGFDLYVWENAGKVFYHFLPGTNRNKSHEETHDTAAAFTSLEQVEKKLDQLDPGQYILLKPDRTDMAVLVTLKEAIRRRPLHLQE